MQSTSREGWKHWRRILFCCIVDASLQLYIEKCLEHSLDTPLLLGEEYYFFA